MGKGREEEKGEGEKRRVPSRRIDLFLLLGWDGGGE